MKVEVDGGYGDNFINVIHQLKVKCKSRCCYNIDDVKALRPLPATHQLTIQLSDYHIHQLKINLNVGSRKLKKNILTIIFGSLMSL